MPIYEYECARCKKVFEVFLTVNDQQVKKCPHCKSIKIKKLVSNCSFQLKGTGWYITDYARKDKNNGKKAKDSEGSTSSEKKEPAAKSEKAASAKTEAGQAA